MNGVRTAELFRRVDAFEHAWCLRLNRGCSQPAVRDIFAAISKLGDGTFWYGLILLLPVVYGETAIYPAVRMAMVRRTCRNPLMARSKKKPKPKTKTC